MMRSLLFLAFSQHHLIKKLKEENGNMFMNKGEVQIPLRKRTTIRINDVNDVSHFDNSEAIKEAQTSAPKNKYMKKSSLKIPTYSSPERQRRSSSMDDTDFAQFSISNEIKKDTNPVAPSTTKNISVNSSKNQTVKTIKQPTKPVTQNSSNSNQYKTQPLAKPQTTKANSAVKGQNKTLKSFK